VKNVLGTEELKQKIDRKHVLIDACVLISATKSGHGDSYLELLEFLRDCHCVLVTSKLSYYEYLRFAKSKKIRDLMDEALRDFGIQMILPVTHDIMNEAEQLLLLYTFQHHQFSTKISLIDGVNGAFVANKKDMILVTEDLQDYPSSIFDCFYMWPVELPTERSLGAVGFFEFNESKFAGEVAKYLATN
jgi:hypothetical protein